MQVQPYLYFDGRCEEAIEFYRKTVGAKVETFMRFKDSPVPCDSGMVPPGAGKQSDARQFQGGGFDHYGVGWPVRRKGEV